MSGNGWIKLHRKFLESPIFKDSQALQLWVYLLLKANHKDGKVLIGNTYVPVNRGELLTGRKSLASGTGINESKIRRLLKLYESDKKVTIKKTTKYSIISITNYDSYQDSDQQLTNKRPTTDQQLTTNKNVNNVKKKEKVKSVTSLQAKKPENVTDEVWDDWQHLRKAKKAPVTKTVLNGAIKEAKKAGLGLNDFLSIWCVRGSQGLQASWLTPEEIGNKKQQYSGNEI